MNRLEVAEYDTAEGIKEHLDSLDDLRQFLDTRREAGYERDMKLGEWCLLGRFSLDSNGNIGKYDRGFSSVIPAEVDPLIPDVIAATALKNHLFRRIKDMNFVIGYTDVTIPNDSCRCVECHEGWTVRNAHDSTVEITSDIISLYDFSDKTINDVNEELKSRKSRDGERWFNKNSWFVRGPYLTDDHKEFEWRSVGEDYKIRESDEGRSIHYRYLHPKCKRERDTLSQREKFEAAIEEAGFEDYEMQPITNQYEGDEKGLPWYRVTTKNGKPFLIGGRRRVINISWLKEDCSIDFLGLDKFSDYEDYVHANGYSDTVEQLDTLRTGFGL